MTLSPHEVLEISIAQLSTLALFVAEETGARERMEAATPEARACREILLTIDGLIPKLHAVSGSK